ncbi:hypothetical protein [Enterococcus mundtii]|uniref:hypothetical protein n=1 Tax=Enterococcus mundtii TaxID=53346 RepID=UPI001CCD026A|nr:hypothetical protein [Enterococcus mundtii]UBM07030.1 hypothetical protein K9N66_14545 [Enterococcus mundtii]UBM07067.1 hypothetical protein K9N66_14310 [Enterococcus mundtii]
MKKYLFYLLPICFLTLAGGFLYQSNQIRSENIAQNGSSDTSSRSPSEQPQHKLASDLTDLGEAMITFVHFDDVNQAILSIGDEEIHFPITVTNIEKNQFELIGLADSPSDLTIGSTFGLAQDKNQQHYYYPLEHE